MNSETIPSKKRQTIQEQMIFYIHEQRFFCWMVSTRINSATRLISQMDGTMNPLTVDDKQHPSSRTDNSANK
jgi:hypothetical protein